MGLDGARTGPIGTRDARHPWVRRIAGVVALIALLLGGALLAAPLLLSTDRVKQIVEARLAEATGGQVRLRGGGSVGLRPYMQVSYSDLAILDGPRTLMTADRMSVRLSPLAALGGRAQVTQVTLLRPVARLGRDATLPLPTLDERPDGPARDLGTLQIEDGRLELGEEAITSIDGAISWADTEAPLEADLTGVWRGALARVSAELSAPRRAARGEPSALRLAIDGKPLRATFEGSAARSAAAGGWSAQGELSLASPAPGPAARWLGIADLASLPLSAVSVTAKARADGKSLTLEALSLTHGEDAAKGQLLFKRNGGLTVQGTLAFETLTLPEVWRWDERREHGVRAPLLAANLAADLRLSAANARLGPLPLARLASTITLADGTLSMDVGYGETGGGTAAGMVRIDGTAAAPVIAAEAKLDGVEMGPVLAALGAPWEVTGSGDLRLRVRGAGTGEERWQSLNGTMGLSVPAGTVDGVDLPALARLASAEPPLGLSSLGGGTTSFQNLSVRATIANGIALLEEAGFASGPLRLDMRGRADLFGSGLALRGRLAGAAPGAGSDAARTVPFVIGGTVRSPFFVPLRPPRSDATARPKAKPAVPAASN